MFWNFGKLQNYIIKLLGQKTKQALYVLYCYKKKMKIETIIFKKRLDNKK